jgi:pimeloyl-ACP methyl ester carboxylesterase
MIGTTIWDYLHIKWWIIFLSAVTPLSACYCVVLVSYYAIGTSLIPRLPWPFEIWAIAETLFYIFIHLPYKLHLQRDANHPPAPSRQERRVLFARCNATIDNPEDYLRKWFLGAQLTDIRKENVKEFFLWAFFNRGGDPGDDDEELEEYVTGTEELLGRRFENGKGNAVCLRLTLDEVKILHRSILWYWCVGFVDMLTVVRLKFYGFHLHRTRLSHFFDLFPWRFLALLSRKKSPAKHLSYWHRPHTSKTQLPIVFIHGIGIGLYPYVDFLAELNQHDDSNDQIGVIAIEMMPVSFRITHPVLDKDVLCSEIHEIIKHHGWDNFVLVSHSYGSAISTHLLKYAPIANQIAAVTLIDPITFLLHLPDVAYNFTYRQPKAANEHQLYYFASMDMGVSHALSRCFFWSDNILWKEDLGDRPVTVSLAEKDLIVNTAAVRRYLELPEDPVFLEKKRSTLDLDVIWNENIDHAQVFDTMPRRRRVLRAIRGHCAQKGPSGALPSVVKY